jgi:hypothetical protein
VAAEPVVGPAHTKLAVCVAKVPVNVPVPVTGLPETVRMDDGRARPTLETVPAPAVVHDVLPEPSVIRTWLSEPLVVGRLKVTDVPAAALTPKVTLPDVDPLNVMAPPVPPLRPRLGVAVADHRDAPRLRICPCVDGPPKFRSSIDDMVCQPGSVAEPVLLPHRRPAAGFPEHWALAVDAAKIRNSPTVKALRIGPIPISRCERVHPYPPVLRGYGQRRRDAIECSRKTNGDIVDVSVPLQIFDEDRLVIAPSAE